MQFSDKPMQINFQLLLPRVRDELTRKQAVREAAARIASECAKVLATAELHSGHTEAAQSCLQSLAKQIQDTAHAHVSRVVSRCLTAVFEQSYELKIEFREIRGKTEAEFYYYRNGHKVDPLLASSGVRHVAGLALRLAELILARPERRRVLFLDEPFSGLSVGNLQKMAVLIETLATELGVQFLIVTHSPALQVGLVHNLDEMSERDLNK